MDNYNYFTIKTYPSIEDSIEGKPPSRAITYRSIKEKSKIIEIINNKNRNAGYLKYQIKFKKKEPKFFRNFDNSQFS